MESRAAREYREFRESLTETLDDWYRDTRKHRGLHFADENWLRVRRHNIDAIREHVNRLDQCVSDGKLLESVLSAATIIDLMYRCLDLPDERNMFDEPNQNRKKQVKVAGGHGAKKTQDKYAAGRRQIRKFANAIWKDSPKVDERTLFVLIKARQKSKKIAVSSDKTIEKALSEVEKADGLFRPCDA